MLIAPTTNSEAMATYTNQELFGVEFPAGAGFFSGLDGSDILFFATEGSWESR